MLYNIPLLKARHFFLEIFFYLFDSEWIELSHEINSENINIFQKRYLEFTRSSHNRICNPYYNPYCTKLHLTKLHFGLSHLYEHKFIHGFDDTINSICICGGDIKSISDFFLHCPKFSEERQTLFENI